MTRPLIDPKLLKPKEEKKDFPTAEEAYARSMEKAAPYVARWLGCCEKCFEDLKLIEGRGWVCLHCDSPVSHADLIDGGTE